MQCLQLTRGEPPATTVDVALSGTFDSTYGYVTIDGTKYTSAQTLTVAKGTSVTVYCSSSQSSYFTKCEITLNGTTVAKGTKGSPPEYTFAATDNCTIVLSKTSWYNYFTAAITMPALDNPVIVNITLGSTYTGYATATVNGVEYKEAASGLEVNSGDIITFKIRGTDAWEGSIKIDGTVVKTTTAGTPKSYEWTVPDGITNIAIELYSNSSHKYSRITVTTS